MKESKHMDDELMPDFLAEPTEAPYIRPKGVEPLEIKKTPGELLLVYSPKNGAKFVDERTELEEECRVASGCFTFRRGDVKDLNSSSICSRMLQASLGD